MAKTQKTLRTGVIEKHTAKLISIRASLLFAMLGLVFFLALALLYAMHLNAQRLVRNMSATIISARTDQVESQLITYFSPVELVLDSLSSFIAAGQFDPLSPSAVNSSAAPLVASVSQIGALTTADGQGNEYRFERTSAGWECRERDVAKYPGRVRVTQSAVPTAPVASESFVASGDDPRTSNWYEGAVENFAASDQTSSNQPSSASTHWTAAHQFQTAADPGISASKLVVLPDGKQVVVALDVLTAELDEYTDNLRPSPYGYIVVTDRLGNLLEPALSTEDEEEHQAGTTEDAAHPARPSIESDHEVMEIALDTWGALHGYDWATAQQAAPSSKVSADESKEDEVFQFTFHDATWLGGIRSFKLDNEPTLYIAVLVPESDLSKELQGQRLALGLITAVSLLLAAGMALAIAAAFSAPIAALAIQSEQIQLLDLHSTQALEVKSSLREISQLSSAHAKMHKALESFACYVPTELVRDLLARGEAARIGGRLVPLSVLITDIRGFTTLCEAQPVERFTQQLAEYFDCLLNLLHEHGATIDKLVGDSVIAFWGAPKPSPDDAGLAINAALAIVKATKAMNSRWRNKGQPALITHVGLTRGDVIVGNIGARWRLSYTAIGDAVNLASRLEKLNPVYGTSVITSSTLRDACGDRYAWRLLDRVAVRGKQSVVEVYEPLGLMGEIEQERLDLAVAYEEALRLVWGRKFDDARLALRSLQQLYPGDRASAALLERLEYLVKHPPAWNWDGAWREKGG